MTYATSSSLRVRIPEPRDNSFTRRRNFLKVLSGGVLAVVIVVVAAASVLTGAGWLLAKSLQARSDVRSVVALATPRRRLPWADLAADGTASPPVIVADSAPPASVRFSEVSMPMDPVGALALVIPGPAVASIAPTEEIHTGSLGPARLAAFDVLPAGRPRSPSAPDEARPIPLPRTRPRLASLSPGGGLGAKPEQEELRPARTAVYDITAQVVYLPGGERLEAHSGLGHMMDDPHYVREKNRGATPPNTYELTLRESLFHGVQAVRLTPVGDAQMFDRDGILAHSYMLGPSGQSNGCVSFRDYPKFLKAYLRGEIDRIVVVSRLAKPPTFAARPSVRSANAL